MVEDDPFVIPCNCVGNPSSTASCGRESIDVNSEHSSTPRIRLGNTGPVVSRLIFGTEHIIDLSPEEGGSILAEAWEEFGVDHWDTAPAYESHPQVAAGLRQVGREHVTITSKTTAKSYEAAEREMGQTLSELDTEYVDIIFLHNVPTGDLANRAGALKYLCEARQSGLVRHVGLSSHSPRLLQEAASEEQIEIVCGTLNRDGSRIDDGSREDMLEALRLCFSRGKGVYVIKILGRGELVYDLEGALEYVCRQPFIHAFNIGMRNRDEIAENLALLKKHMIQPG